MNTRIGKRRALNIIRRMLDGEELTTSQVRRWEIADLQSLGFHIQGEQSSGYMAGQGKSSFWIPGEYVEEDTGLYLYLRSASPDTIAKLHESDMAKTKTYSSEYVSCIICQLQIKRTNAVFPITPLGSYPVCELCAKAVCDAVVSKAFD